MAQIESAIAGYTPVDELRAGRRCTVQCDGLVTAGVPIGTIAFVRSYARARLLEWTRAHMELEHLRDTQSAYLLLRYSLSRRFGFLLRTCGGVLAAPLDQDGDPPTRAHDDRLFRSLAYVLTDPTLPSEARDARALHILTSEDLQQAILPTRVGGLALDCSALLWAPTHLAGAAACLPYLYTHRAFYCLDAAFGSGAGALPYFCGLSVALTALHADTPVAQQQYTDLRMLLADSPPSLHDLSTGVFLGLRTSLLARCSDDASRARLLSAGGLHAGSWLTVFPMTPWATVRGRHYQLGLCMRLGIPLPELMPVPPDLAPMCGGCATRHDPIGSHPSICRVGNRRGLWTARHDAVQAMLLHVIRRLGYSAQSVSVGAGGWFGAAGFSADGRTRRADLVLTHYYGPGRHLFLDVAVTSPTTGAALSASPSSGEQAGVAAALRAATKVRKYAPLAAAVSSSFRPAVVERFGTCCDELVGLIRTLCGDRDRDALRCEDYTFSAPSRSTYMAGLVTLATVAADAAMVEHVVLLDAQLGGIGGRLRGCGVGLGALVAPRQVDVEGVGGRFWYEGRA